MYDFNRDFNRDFDRQFNSVKRTAIDGVIIGIVFKFTLIGGLIYFIFWCLKYFGII
jgi:tetrahydromethanopterin S-methyltransferase subunit F